MRVAISSCLLGAPVRYDGGSVPSRAVCELAQRVEAVSVCPECLGGLSVPRKPVELLGGRALCADGTDVTEEFVRGAARAREVIGKVSLAVLKERSPSCGSSVVFDGTHSGRRVEGSGLFARLLADEGVCVVSELEVERFAASAEHPVALVLGCGLEGLAPVGEFVVVPSLQAAHERGCNCVVVAEVAGCVGSCVHVAAGCTPYLRALAQGLAADASVELLEGESSSDVTQAHKLDLGVLALSGPRAALEQVLRGLLALL